MSGFNSEDKGCIMQRNTCYLLDLIIGKFEVAFSPRVSRKVSVDSAHLGLTLAHFIVEAERLKRGSTLLF